MKLIFVAHPTLNLRPHPIHNLRVEEESMVTSIGGQASLRCFVESFPKAITYWTKKSNHPEYFDRLIEKRLVSALIHP